MQEPEKCLEERKINENLLLSSLHDDNSLKKSCSKHEQTQVDTLDPIIIARGGEKNMEIDLSQSVTPKISNNKGNEIESLFSFSNDSSENSEYFMEPLQENHKLMKDKYIANTEEPVNLKSIPNTIGVELKQPEFNEEDPLKDIEEFKKESPSSFLEQCMNMSGKENMNYDKHIAALQKLHDLWKENVDVETNSVHSEISFDASAKKECKSVNTVQYLEQELVLLRQKSRIDLENLRKELEQEKQTALYEERQSRALISKEDEIQALREEYEQEATVSMECIRREYQEAQTKAIEEALNEQRIELEKVHKDKLDDALSSQEIQLKKECELTLATRLSENSENLQERHNESLLKAKDEMTKQLEKQRYHLEVAKEAALKDYREKSEVNNAEMIQAAGAKFLGTSQKLIDNHREEIENMKFEHLQHLEDQRRKFQSEIDSQRLNYDERIEQMRKMMKEKEPKVQNTSDFSHIDISSTSCVQKCIESIPKRTKFEELHRLQQQRERTLREAIEKINESLEQNNQDEKTLLDLKIRQVEELENEIQELKSKHRSYAEDMVKKYDSKRKDTSRQHEHKVNEMQIKIDSALVEARDVASRLVESENKYANERREWIEKHEREVCLLQQSLDEKDKMREKVETALVAEKSKMIKEHKDEIESLRKSMDEVVSRSREEKSHHIKSLENLAKEKDQIIESYEDRLTKQQINTNKIKSGLEASFVAERSQIIKKHKNEIESFQKSMDEVMSKSREEESYHTKSVEDLSKEKEKMIESYENRLADQQVETGKIRNDLQTKNEDLENEIQELKVETSEKLSMLEKDLEEATAIAEETFNQLKYSEDDFERQKEEILFNQKKDKDAMQLSLDKARDEVCKYTQEVEKLRMDFETQRREILEQHKSEISKLEVKLSEALGKDVNRKALYMQPEKDSEDDKADLVKQSRLIVTEISKIMDRNNQNDEKISREKDESNSSVSENMNLTVENGIRITEEKLHKEYDCKLKATKLGKTDEEVEKAIEKAVKERTERLCNEFHERLRTALEAKQKENEREIEAVRQRINSKKSEGKIDANMYRISELESQLQEGERFWKEEKNSLESRHFTKLEMLRKSHQVQLRKCEERIDSIERTKALELENMRTEYKTKEVAIATDHNVQIQDLMQQNMVELNESIKKSAALEILLARYHQIMEKIILRGSGESFQITDVQKELLKLREEMKPLKLGFSSHERIKERKEGDTNEDANVLSKEIQGVEPLSESPERSVLRPISKETSNSSRNYDSLRDPPSLENIEIENTERYTMDKTSKVMLQSNNPIILQDSSSFEVDKNDKKKRKADSNNIPISPLISLTPPRSQVKSSALNNSLKITGSEETTILSDETPATIVVSTPQSSLSKSSAKSIGDDTKPLLSFSSAEKRRNISSISHSMSRSMSDSQYRVRLLQNMKKTIDREDSETRVLLNGSSTPQIVEMVNDLGAILIDTIEKAHTATHIVIGETLRRTAKLMIALCATSNVVTMEWLLNSHRNKRILNPNKYLCLSDRRAEKRYGFSMKRTLFNGSSNREKGGLLKGWTIVIAKGVAGYHAPSLTELRLLLRAAGAKQISIDQFRKVENKEKCLVITSDPPTQNQTKYVNHVGAQSMGTACLFDCVMHQKISGVKSSL